LHQSALGQTFLQVIPGRIGDFALGALGFGLIGAQKYMTGKRTDPVIARDEG
jgi:hypothetical protein